jgi:hypothetical protein
MRRLLGLVALVLVLPMCGAPSSDVPPPTPTTPVVGVKGGTVTGSDGARLVVPEGALDQDVAIVITPSAAAAPSGYVAHSPVYVFTPDGLVFKKPVTIELPLPATAKASDRIIWSSKLRGVEVLTSSVAGATMSAQVTHFSEGFIGDAEAPVACANGTWDADQNPSTPCVGWKSCDPGTYVSAAGTATTDRQCAKCADGTHTTTANQSSCVAEGACPAGTAGAAPNCTPCAAGSYCAGGASPSEACAAGTWDDDANPATVCVTWSTCVAGQHVSVDGTATTDRACTSCTSGSFSATPNAATCTLWTSCTAGNYVSTNGSVTADRQCTACAPGTTTTTMNQSTCIASGGCDAGTERTAPGVCTPCETGTYCAGGETTKQACPSGTWDNDSSSATECIAWTDCAPGQRVTASGSATVDRTCTACASGTYSNVSNASTCTAWSDCGTGTFVSTPGSTTTDRQCATCASGTTTTATNQSSCVATGGCAAGTERTAPGVCSACASGYYCAGGETTKVACAAGYWDHDNNAATACVAKTTCVAGESVVSDGTATADRQCASCASGSFSTTSNAPSCTAWSSCAAGTYVSVPGTPSSDRQCADCTSGTYTTQPNQSVCLAADACAAGTEQTAPATSTSPPQCAACAAGNYCPGGTTAKQACASSTWDHDANAATACVNWTNCSAGQFVAADGTTTTDRSCQACASGSYSTTANASSCTPWVACSAGTEQTTAGSTTASPQCASCAAGYYCPGGTTAKQACPSGTWDHDANAATACVNWKSCSAGEVEIAAGTTTTDRQCATPLLTAGWSVGMSGNPYALGQDTSGNLYVAGYTQTAFPGQTQTGTYDAYVQKISASTGGITWTRQFGVAAKDTEGRGVAVDTSGNVYVVGYTNGALVGSTTPTGFQFFVRKYDSSGGVAWTYQHPTSGYLGMGVAIDTSGYVDVLTSYSNTAAALRLTAAGGALAGGPRGFNGNAAGSVDVDANGNGIWVETGVVYKLSTDWDPNSIGWGATMLWSSPQTGANRARANGSFVSVLSSTTLTKLSNATGTTSGGYVLTAPFGASATMSELDVDANGNVIVAGTTSAALSGNASLGGIDAFVGIVDASGKVVGAYEFGSASSDSVKGVRATASSIYVLGFAGSNFLRQFQR